MDQLWFRAALPTWWLLAAALPFVLVLAMAVLLRGRRVAFLAILSLLSMPGVTVLCWRSYSVGDSTALSYRDFADGKIRGTTLSAKTGDGGCFFTIYRTMPRRSPDNTLRGPLPSVCSVSTHPQHQYGLPFCRSVLGFKFLYLGAPPGGRGVIEWQVAVVVPFWAFYPPLAVFPALWLRKYARRRLRSRHGQCLDCGYDLRASPDRCPECGVPVPPAKGKQTPTAAPLGAAPVTSVAGCHAPASAAGESNFVHPSPALQVTNLS